MNNKMSEFEKRAIEKISESCPITNDEIKRRHPDFVAMALAHCQKAADQPGLAKILQLGVLKFAFAVKGLIEVTSNGPQFTKGFSPASVRGADGPEPTALEAEEDWHQAKYEGNECVGKMLLRADKDGTARFTFALEDIEGRDIQPVYLTVKDQDGVVIRERTPLRGQLDGIREVDLADYTIILENEDGSQCVNMGIQSQV